MLVGRPKSLDGRRTDVDLNTLNILTLAETLGPELAVPVCKVLKGITIRHHYRNIFPAVIIMPVDRGVDRCRILPENS